MSLATDIQTASIAYAYFLGEAYVEGLAVGDSFIGVGGMAEDIGFTGSQRSAFISGGLDRMAQLRLQLWGAHDSLRVTKLERLA